MPKEKPDYDKWDTLSLYKEGCSTDNPDTAKEIGAALRRRARAMLGRSAALRLEQDAHEVENRFKPGYTFDPSERSKQETYIAIRNNGWKVASLIREGLAGDGPWKLRILKEPNGTSVRKTIKLNIRNIHAAKTKAIPLLMKEL